MFNDLEFWVDLKMFWVSNVDASVGNSYSSAVCKYIAQSHKYQCRIMHFLGDCENHEPCSKVL